MYVAVTAKATLDGVLRYRRCPGLQLDVDTVFMQPATDPS